MPATPAITQNEAVEHANVTRVQLASAEQPLERDGQANASGRFRSPDVIDPYLLSQARRKHPDWRMIRSEDPDGDCGCM